MEDSVYGWSIRQKAWRSRGKVLAKVFDAQNDRVYVIQELASMEVIQNAMAKNQDKIKEAEVDMSTMQMIPLQDWFKKRFFPGLENQNE